jgi:stearoyl-CoA desaturase (delta-9 desaturase)
VSAGRRQPAQALIPRPRVPLVVQACNVGTIILPFLGLVAAIVLLWGRGFHWLHLALLAGMYTGTGLGVTIGFHRLLTHRSFETTRWVKFVLGVLGSMAVQGPVLRWVATHRRHHQHSDQPADPHSPHLHGHGIRGLLRGLWHAHMGWLFRPDAPDLHRYVGDHARDPLMRRVSAWFPIWVLAGLLIPTAVGGLAAGSWSGALLGLIWGGLARVFLLHHVTWSINSVCHLWGTRPFDCDDHSRNNFLFGLLAWGEGWHNNHHAFPTSARHGLRWWQIDVSYAVIRTLAWLDLAWNIRMPAAEAMAARLAVRT